MDLEAKFQRLEAVPRLSWAPRQSAITSLDATAQWLGLASLHAWRDDLLSVGLGGSKIRKLDFLCASKRYANAKSWASVGAWGSGHLVALAQAASLLGISMTSACFAEPLDRQGFENLALTSSLSEQIFYSPSRLTLVARYPKLFLGGRFKGAEVVPPGATCTVGMLGLVRAGLGIAQAVLEGKLPKPDVLVLPFGSGGTAIGLAAGLALAELPVEIRAVSAVEPWLVPLVRTRMLQQSLDQTLEYLGLSVSTPPLSVDFSQLGAGYGHATAASRHAVAYTKSLLPLEPCYSGKAFASLCANVPRGKHVLFYVTPRRATKNPPMQDFSKWPASMVRDVIRNLLGE